MMTLEKLPAGAQVRVVQRIDKRAYSWTSVIEGTLLDVCDLPTGSWYAHGKDDRYWLKRLRLRKADGEVTLLLLDPHSTVELIDAAAAKSSP